LGRPSSPASCKEEESVVVREGSRTDDDARYAVGPPRASSVQGGRRGPGRGSRETTYSRQLMMSWSPVTGGVVLNNRVDFVSVVKTAIPENLKRELVLDPFQVRRLDRFRSHQLGSGKTFRDYFQIDYAYRFWL